MDIDKEKGFLKLYRGMLTWEWYNEPNVKILFIHCLLKANYTDKKWQGKTIKKGSFVSSLDNLSKELRMSKMQIRTALAKLQSTNEISCKTTSRYTYITLNNWNKYQEEKTTNDYKGNNDYKPKTINDIEELRKIFDISFPDKENFMPEAQKWLDYMREKGKKLNNKASIEAFVKKLIDLSGGNIENAENIINNAIAHNWNGIYPLISEKNKPNESAKANKQTLTDREAYYDSLARSD